MRAIALARGLSVTTNPAMRTLALIALAAILSLNAAELPFKPAAEYSCNFASTGGQHEGKGRMVVGKPGTRMEIEAQGQKMIMIMRKDEKMVHMLMVDMKMVMDMPMNQAAFQDPTKDSTAVWTKTGSETVNGVACDRYDWKGQNGSGGTAWVDASKGVMMRAKDAKGSQMDFTDYKLGAQADSEFAVPADYKPMNAGAFGGQ